MKAGLISSIRSLHGRGLGQRRVKVQRLVVDGPRPVHLLEARRAEEVARVVGDGEGALEPALVELQGVGVPVLDDVPGVAKLLAQLGVCGQAAGEVLGEHGADGLVRVRRAKDEGVLGTVAYLEAQQRPILAGAPDLEELHRLGELGGKRTAALVELVGGEEHLVVGDGVNDLLEHGLECHGRPPLNMHRCKNAM